MVKKLFQKRIVEILDKFKDKNIILSIKNANFFGQKSHKSTQIRGNGVLILTADDLYFEMSIDLVEIPLF